MFVGVPLSSGQRALINEADWSLVEPYAWHEHNRGYAVASGGHPLMHRLILDAPKGVLVDHINGDKLDNRRANLRLATHSLNGHNRHASDRPAGIRVLPTGRFHVYLWIRNKNTYIGAVDTEREAVALRAQAELEHFGEMSPATVRYLGR